MTDPKPEETYSEEETKQRAAAALQRMLATPHKPHKEATSAAHRPDQTNLT